MHRQGLHLPLSCARAYIFFPFLHPSLAQEIPPSCCCPHHMYSGCQLVAVFVCLKLQIFNKVRAQWHWYKYAMREAKQVKSGKKNGEKTIFLALSFRSISCSAMLGRGLPCLNSHFSPYLYSRIVSILCHPCVVSCSWKFSQLLWRQPLVLVVLLMLALLYLIWCAHVYKPWFCTQSCLKATSPWKYQAITKFTWFSWEVKVFSI